MILLGAIARDEGPYLEEWAEHHLALGFDRIVVYDNGAVDAGPLRRLADARRQVEVRPWPGAEGQASQPAAYADCLDREGGDARWIMFLDIDEFLNLKAHHDVQAFCEAFSAFDAVAVNWRIFGSAGEERSDGRPVTVRFTRASVREFWPNTHVKTIFRPRSACRAGVHGPDLLPGARVVNARAEPVEAGPNLARAQIAHEVAQVNHYFTKSRTEFAAKRIRGRADMAEGEAGKHRIGAEFALHDRNEEEDRSILRFRQPWTLG